MNSKDISAENTIKYFKACCDIYEYGGKVFLELEMPGVSQENLDIKVADDMLIIHGRKHIAQEKGSFLVKEIREGDYHHEYSIDDTIDRNKIEASLKNGIATISMGIKESEKPRKISISVK